MEIRLHRRLHGKVSHQGGGRLGGALQLCDVHSIYWFGTESFANRFGLLFAQGL